MARFCTSRFRTSRFRTGLIPLLMACLCAPAALAAPVEVTRFHTPESLARLDRGPITVMNAADTATGTLESEIWRNAVQQALTSAGFTGADTSAKVAIVRVARRTWKPERDRERVSVGVGGSTGSYGSGVGLGIGINLGGGSREQTETTLSVTIRDLGTGQSLWEGRAVQTVRANAKEARAQITADRLARALFSGFPGKSGETIRVK